MCRCKRWGAGIGCAALMLVLQGWPVRAALNTGVYTNLTCTVGSVPSTWNVLPTPGYTVTVTPLSNRLTLNIRPNQGTAVFFR